jgi:DNA-binding transcriptional LysR family regulator
MELRHLRYFVSVAEELHFGRAARRLHMSQPPLSQQIRQLEAEVGADLLLRSRHGVTLTPAGEALLPEARATLEHADRALAAARRSGDVATTHVELGFVSSASYLLPRLLPELRRLVPDLSLSVHEGSTTEQVEMLRSGTLSVGLLRPPVIGTGIAALTVAEESLVVALPVGHPLAERAALELRDLVGEPFVLFARAHGHALFDQISSACRDAGFVPDIAQVSKSMGTIVDLVAGGLGVSLVPASVARPMAGVIFREPSDLRVKVALDVAWHEEAPHPQLVDAVVQAARHAVGAVAVGPPVAAAGRGDAPDA